MMRRFFAAFLALALIASQASAFVLNPYRLASSGETSLFAKLTALGLTTSLQIALDAGDSTSAGGAFANDGNTTLLLHFDGSNGSTTFTDSSSNAFTVTPSADAQISTSQSVFGGASGGFDGTGDQLSISYTATLHPGSSNFTWEARLRPATVAGDQTIWSQGSSYGPFAIIRIGADYQFFATTANGSWNVANGVSMGAAAANTWTALRVVRNGTAIKLYKDGAQVGSDVSVSGSLYNPTANFLIGAGAGLSNYNGNIDELRYSVGTARSTGTSYNLAGEKWYDLSGNGEDFFAGSSIVHTTANPTFIGTSGNLSSSEYWLHADENQFFTYDTSNETWMQNMHKDNAAFTWAFWVYTGPLGAAGQTLFTTIDLDTTDTGAIGYISTTGNLAFVVVSSGISVYAAGTSAELSGVSTGAWHFMAFSVDEAGNAINWNQDGLEATESATYNTPSSGSATSTLQIGGGYANLTGGDNSRLGEVAAWSRALTQAELRNVYAATKGRYQ